MNDLDHYTQKASKDGRPPKPGIILGIRMCLLALRQLEISDVTAHKRSLIVVVETDRCLPDAVQLVTGCRLGNRTLKLRDMGKMAATFVDLKKDRALRLAGRESANANAAEKFPTLTKEEALSRAYHTVSDDELFHAEWVRVHLDPADLPGHRVPRVICEQCGEGVGFHREVRIAGRVLCRACTGERYYDPL
jgi:formylmethanofuran dehydrogenase subunit E